MPSLVLRRKYTSLDDLSGKRRQKGASGSNYAQLLENWNHANADKTPITINYASSSTVFQHVFNIFKKENWFILYDAISFIVYCQDQGYS